VEVRLILGTSGGVERERCDGVGDGADAEDTVVAGDFRGRCDGFRTGAGGGDVAGWGKLWYTVPPRDGDIDSRRFRAATALALAPTSTAGGSEARRLWFGFDRRPLLENNCCSTSYLGGGCVTRSEKIIMDMKKPEGQNGMQRVNKSQQANV
jgi:hypothetical protein